MRSEVMGVYIKGMKMPKTCYECWALDDDYDYPMCRITQEQRGYTFNTRGQKMAKCPLIDVLEPHGRLIDADALADDLETDGKEFGDEMKLNCASWLRSNATLTVIERSDYE